MSSLQDKIKGMYIGAILGDALGRRIEFMSRSQIRKKFPNTEIYLKQFRSARDVTISDETSLLFHSIDYFYEPTGKYEEHLGKIAEKRLENLRRQGFSAKMRNLLFYYKNNPEEPNPYTNNSGSGFVPLALPLVQKFEFEEDLERELYVLMDKTHRSADKVWAFRYFSALHCILRNKPLIWSICEPTLEDIVYDDNLRIALSGNIEAINIIDGSARNILPSALALYIASEMNFIKMLNYTFSQFDSADYDTLFFCTGALIGAGVGYENLPRELIDVVEQKFDVGKIDEYVNKTDLTIEPTSGIDCKATLKSLVCDNNIFDVKKNSQLFDIIPELCLQRGYNSNQPRHNYTLLEHTLRTVESLPKDDYILRLAGLLHDISKPFVRGKRNNNTTYYNHAKCSARMSYDVLTRLGFSEEEKTSVCILIEKHVVNYTAGWSDKAVTRFVRKNGMILERLFKLMEADNSAQLASPEGNYTEFKRRISQLMSY
ncbi:ADP-ribosylglycohydrolase family protein [Candidatus Woesearchaeota archaeon]|nr:ADP-ribosylglycohydrolase family protein [Candidatus Woesearchaeota archaeon]